MAQAAESVTLDNCDREPIHIPGAIQPHGVLFACRGPALTIGQVSANVSQHVGSTPEQLLGASFLTHVDLASQERIRAALASESLREANPVLIGMADGAAFDAVLHRSGDVVVLELEPTTAASVPHPHEGFDPRLRASALRLQSAREPAPLMRAAADEVRRLTGFDRVMVYRFDREWNGQVVAESKRDDLGSFLHQHYPASDIPAQARRLYTINWLRFVGDVRYAPVPLVPALDPATGAPLDMSHSTLRSVSPIHIEYLTNMGVTASMSISLVVDDELRGLIACHHYSGPRVVGVTVRDTAEYLGYTLSWQLRVVEEAEKQRRAGQAKAFETAILRSITAAIELADGLDTEALVKLTDAAGVAVVLQEGTRRLGTTPKPDVIRTIVEWLKNRQQGEVFSTDHLEKEMPAASEWQGVAGGLLAVAIARGLGEYILWFRPAIEQTVAWAGEPSKIVVGEGVTARLSPRGSFELWREVVRGRARPWERWELEAATSLRQLLLGGVRTRAVQLRDMNARLLAADRAKDNFVATVSHELRTPLNAISGWSSILLKDSSVAAPGRRGLEVIARNVNVQLQLIEDLLDISRITSGKISLRVEQVDLPSIVESAIEACSLAVGAKGLKLETRLVEDVRAIRGDGARLRQVVTNLLTNAVKFTPKGGTIAVKVVHEESEMVLEVKDSGQGIEPDFLPHVFDAFRQQDDGFSRRAGGLGLGLAIVKKLVELHGGRISAESDGVGHGSVFRVRLPITPLLAQGTLSNGDDASPSRIEATSEGALAGLKILVVEDDEDSRDMILHLLRGSQAAVTAASDGRQALSILELETYDVMVSDVGMPEMDGLELIRKVRAELPEPSARIPAIALTAYTRAIDRTTAIQAGFQSHVPKPVDPDELIAVILSVLERA